MQETLTRGLDVLEPPSGTLYAYPLRAACRSPDELTQELGY
jgi:hypothetical protein